MALKDYLQPFYKWDECPHVERLRSEKHPISQQHVKHQWALIDKYILTDPIADRNVHELRRGDILDFRQRLLIIKTDRQANRIIGVLKTCIKEGVFREELDRDPTLGVGRIRHGSQERGVFTQKEIKALFPAEGPGPWGDLKAYVCFLLAATTGMRRGEILALRWGDVGLKEKVYHVRQAWIDDTHIGLPKWRKVRENLPLPDVVVKKLKELRTERLHVLPDALVLHKDDGSRLSLRWWQDKFRAAMVKAKIKAKERTLTAHSFRHSLNTLLRAQGIPDEQIRAAMGWTTAKVQDIYTHLSAEHLRSQASAVDRIFKTP